MRNSLSGVYLAALTVAFFGPPLLGHPASAAAVETGDRGTEIHVSEYTGIIQSWQPESEMDLSPRPEQGMVIWEVSRFPEQWEATAEQLATAEDLRRRATDAVREREWYDFESALVDGYELMFDDANHYANRDYIMDGRTLDPERPEFLIYYDTHKGKKLAGYMFLVSRPEERGAQIGGPLTLWHYHRWHRAHCLDGGLLVSGVADENGDCAVGIASHKSPEMLHLWFYQHSGGPFATNMDLEPFQIKELEDLEF